MRRSMTQFRLAIGLTLILGLSAAIRSATAALPSVVHCYINAKASRAFDQKHGWAGGIISWGKADKTAPFQITERINEGTALFSAFLFGQLDTLRPHIRAIPSRRDASGIPAEGHERTGIVIHRSAEAVFFVWVGAPDEIFTVGLHLPSQKAVISTVSTGLLYNAGVTAMTADCE